MSSISKDFVYDDGRQSLFYSWFSVIAAATYYESYIGLSLAALVSALYVAWRGDRALTALGDAEPPRRRGPPRQP